MSIVLPVRGYRPVAWGAVCPYTKLPSSALLAVAEVAATPVTIHLGTPPLTSAVKKLLERRSGHKQGVIGGRPTGESTERGEQIGVGATLPPLAAELPEKSTLFSWVIGALHKKLRSNTLSSGWSLNKPLLPTGDCNLCAGLIIGKDTPALQPCALELMLRIGYRLTSEYKEIFMAPVSSSTAPYSLKDRPCEHSLGEDRTYDLPEHHTRDVRGECDHGFHPTEELKGG